MMHQILRKISKIIIFLIFNLVVVSIVFLMFEGFSSTLFVVRRIITNRPLAERLHTKYDEELGWVNIPNVYIKDMYGSGIYLKTNSQLFRNNDDFDETIKEDKVRIVCSGDSFTLGYGVDNDHTWCQILASIDTKLETVNMGQGGYGIDQSYLWYKRNSTKIEHDIHIFAFINECFNRMEKNNFFGYGKPVLQLRDGILATKNTPVSKRGFYVPWLTHILEGTNQLSSFKLLKGFASQKGEITLTGKDQKNNNMKDIIIKIFDELHHINQNKNSILVLVYLPTRDDYVGNLSEKWRRLIDTHLDKEKVVYMDLIEDFRRVPPEEIDKMFIGPGVFAHYSEEGNAYIANILYKKLVASPKISKKRNR